MRNRLLYPLISQYRGQTEANSYINYNINNINIVGKAIQDCLASVPPSFGACTMLSSYLAGYLKDDFGIPAIVLAGDLEINGTTVFHCKENLPAFDKPGEITSAIWEGHSWVEIDNYIIDISIFRSAYSIDRPSILKSYIIETFGNGRGAILSPVNELPHGMNYIPKYILNDTQINGLVASLAHKLKHGI